MMAHQLIGQVALMVFPLLLIIAGAGDVMTLRIPNSLSIVFVLGFGIFAWALGMPLTLMAQHAGAAVLLLMAGFVLFAFGLWGGGDAKLLAAAGLWLGFPCIVPLVLFTVLAGGAVALAVAMWSALHLEAGLHSSWLERVLGSFSPDVPYGFAIAAGAILTIPLSWWAQITT